MGEEVSEASLMMSVLKDAPCKAFKDTFGSISFFNTALCEAFNQGIGYYNSIKSLAVIIITSAVRSIQITTQLKYDVPVKSDKDDFRFTIIKKFIEDNMSSPVSTCDIAGYMHLSDKQICRIIEKRTGITTKEFIIKMKLEKAKEMLKESHISIKQIAEELGFSSEYYFNQFFKREEGYPPGIFRNNIHHNKAVANK